MVTSQSDPPTVSLLPVENGVLTMGATFQLDPIPRVTAPRSAPNGAPKKIDCGHKEAAFRNAGRTGFPEPESDNVFGQRRKPMKCSRLAWYAHVSTRSQHVLLPRMRVTSLACTLLLSERDHGIYVNRPHARNRTSKQGNRRQDQDCRQIGGRVCRNRTKKE